MEHAQRTKAYPVIEDWSVEGRRALIEREAPRIRALLDQAFTDFCDDYELSRWGFRGDDAVAEAVEWCVERFCAEKPIDPEKLEAGSRSFRLFTQPDWWLAQKATSRGHRARKAVPVLDRAAHSSGCHDPDGGDVGPADRGPGSEGRGSSGRADAGRRAEDRVADALDAKRFPERLRSTLRSLFARAAADLVSFWLIGTEAWRARTFGWSDPIPEPQVEANGKALSFRVHDALFRFQCIFLDLLEPGSESRRVVIATMFSGAPNEPPYRKADREVLRTLDGVEASGVRAVTRLRKDGSGELLLAILARVRRFPQGDHARDLGAESISKTTLWALEIADRSDLREAVESFVGEHAHG